jgi:CheY-like chemotaxis protein
MDVFPEILIVDDDADALAVLANTLGHCGYVLTETTSSKEALDLVGRRKFDLLIVDLSMPEPDGFEVLQYLRSQLPRPKIIVISGFLQGMFLPVAKLLGAVAGLEKPINSELLISTVEDALNSN